MIRTEAGQAELNRAIIYEIGPKVEAMLSGQKTAWIERDGDLGSRLHMFTGSRNSSISPAHRSEADGYPTAAWQAATSQGITVDRFGQAQDDESDPREWPLAQPIQFITADLSLTGEVHRRINLEIQHRFQHDPGYRDLRSTGLREARRITRKAMGGMTPAATGRVLMKQLLGLDNYRRTLRIAGPHATLREHGLIHRNPGIMEEVHTINPNAALIWINVDDCKIKARERSLTNSKPK